MNNVAEAKNWAEGLPNKAHEIRETGINALGDDVSEKAKGAILAQATIVAIAIPKDKDVIDKVIDYLVQEGGISQKQANDTLNAMVNKKLEIDGRAQSVGRG